MVVETTTIVKALNEFLLLAFYYFLYSRSMNISSSKIIHSSDHYQI